MATVDLFNGSVSVRPLHALPTSLIPSLPPLPGALPPRTATPALLPHLLSSMNQLGFDLGYQLSTSLSLTLRTVGKKIKIVKYNKALYYLIKIKNIPNL